jgi:hypothetical protein
MGGTIVIEVFWDKNSYRGGLLSRVASYQASAVLKAFGDLKCCRANRRITLAQFKESGAPYDRSMVLKTTSAG